MVSSNTWSAEEESTFWKAWWPRFNEYFASHSTANKAYGGLLLAGCNPLVLARFLYGVTGSSTSELEQSRAKIGEFAKQLDSALPKITAMSALFEELSQKATEVRASADEFSSLSAQLSACIPIVVGFRNMSLKLSHRRLPKTGDHLLALVHTYLRVVTGKAQWSALAYLIEAAYFGHGLSMDSKKDAVRNKIARLADKKPAFFSGLEEHVRNYLKAGNGCWPSRQDFEEMVSSIILQQIADAKQSQ